MEHNIDDRSRIQPYEGNRFYWQYRGAPVLLLGGSVTDNLFQIPDIEQHLDLLKSVGGNYVRSTMHGRYEGNARAFARDAATGLYDLAVWNDEYWRRFSTFLELTFERDIFVQVEIWATWDHYRGCWPRHPFNPRNNSTFTDEESGLPEQIDYHPSQKIQPFFRSLPELDDLGLVRGFQEAFVDRLLSHSLDYGHVLYCMDNETNADPRWGWHWSRYIKGRAAERGVSIETTEMWDRWDITDGAAPRVHLAKGRYPFWQMPQHSYTLDHPEIYSFLDISQNNMQRGQVHYDNMQMFRERVLASGVIRPINCVKVYGGEVEWASTHREGQERFWRNVFGGLAGTRFHCPRWGIGLSPAAQVHIKGLRMLTAAMDVFTCEPHNELLGERGENEAYCLADPGAEYAVCFMDGGAVTLDCSEVSGDVEVRWLDVANGAWSEAVRSPAGQNLRLTAPGEGFRIALVKPAGC